MCLFMVVMLSKTGEINFIGYSRVVNIVAVMTAFIMLCSLKAVVVIDWQVLAMVRV